jgi:hypothetical protein
MIQRTLTNGLCESTSNWRTEEATRLHELVESARRALRIGLASRAVLREREASHQQHLTLGCVSWTNQAPGRRIA